MADRAVVGRRCELDFRDDYVCELVKWVGR